MTDKAILAALLAFALCWSSQWQCTGACTDISTHIACTDQNSNVIDTNNQPENKRVCYKTTVDDECFPTTCTAEEISATNFDITFLPENENSTSLQAKIWTPGNLRGRNYQNRRLCNYHAKCPSNTIAFYLWSSGHFILEDEDITEGCLDYTHILLEPSDRCGTETAYNVQITSPLKVRFQSNTGTRDSGFQIDILCVDPGFEGSGSGGTSKRSVEPEFGGVRYEEDSLIFPSGRFPGCLDVQSDEDSKTVLVEPSTIKLEERRVKSDIVLDVPRGACIEYDNNIITIQARGFSDKLRTFPNIKSLKFWNDYLGTRLFRRSTERRLREDNTPTCYIYGGGTLHISESIATYITHRIPYELEPKKKEIELIQALLDATTPFFVDQDVEDIEFDEIDEKEKKQEETLVRIQQRRRRRQTRLGEEKIVRPSLEPVLPSLEPIKPTRPVTRLPTDDVRLNRDALQKAETYERACNPFLRAASESYLRILEQNNIRPQRFDYQ